MKVVLITESYDGESSISMLAFYDLLPTRIRKKVDKAIANGGVLDIEYEDGLQSLDFDAFYFVRNNLPVTITEVVEVTFCTN